MKIIKLVPSRRGWGMRADHGQNESGVSWIVVTDLDGTLLDHHSYSYAPAQSAMDRLAEQGIPLILNTSKTRSELVELRCSLGNHEPFIVENGSAVFIPKRRFTFATDFLQRECEGSPAVQGADGFDCKVFGRDYEAIVAWLQARRERYRFESFSDYSVADLIARTGLPQPQAALALTRDFSEPLVWQDSDDALVHFERELAIAGLSSLRGGRFLHILGQCDKGQSLAWLRRCYETSYQQQWPLAGPHEVRVIALGDSHNDIAMLEAADIAVVVRSPRHEPPTVKGAGTVIVSEREGPDGWADVVHSLLDGVLS
jgi:mannosyl-3-phosphoglycerate phosphatase